MDEEIRQLERRLRAAGQLQQFVIEVFTNFEESDKEHILNEITAVNLRSQKVGPDSHQICIYELPDNELLRFLEIRSGLGPLPSNETILKAKKSFSIQPSRTIQPSKKARLAQGMYLEALKRGLVDNRKIIKPSEV